MRAELKYLHTPDAPSLRLYAPENSSVFGIFVEAMVGPEGDDSSESFGFQLCTPRWLEQAVKGEASAILSGRHHLIVESFDYDALHGYVNRYCSSCTGETWSEVAHRVGRLGRWEFEDYRP